MRRACLALLLAGAASPAATAPMTFGEAAARLVTEAPALRAADAARRAAEAGLLDADRRPNPSADIEIENFAGTGPYRGVDGAEITAVIEQPIELGGKRRARTAVARADIALALAERQGEARRLLAELARTYGNAAASRARATIAQEQVALAETLAAQSARRLAVGDIAEVEHDRVLVSLGEARTELERNRRDTETAERNLALLVGATEAVEADPSFLATGSVDPAQIAIVTADDSRIAAIADRERARVAAARAGRIPDLTARGGVRVAREEEAVALVAGVSIPLPFFNNGRARVVQAQAEAERANLAAEAQRRDARRTAERALGNWRSALRSLENIEGRTLPAAERLVALTERGYRLGALPYRDLADAQTSLYASRRARIDAQEQVATAKADVAEVTGAYSALGLPILSERNPEVFK
ncbi:TolC family protein [Sphingomonas sp. LHG3406-1]|uniref:TolC family protein n=1 Tax=Sphingomonas sp. LHG3406-1 TaxID=2804617 RepID=UPI0026384B9E|nr:TolC family protein [Sphingomonas sp. LHG3406-1]